jgi:hypothetical protein
MRAARIGHIGSFDMKLITNILTVAVCAALGIYLVWMALPAWRPPFWELIAL